MNECLKLGSRKGRSNVWVWLSGAFAAGFTENANYH